MSKINQLNNINVSIFCALKVSEMSKVPVLLMANPGTGKSSTVEMFADVRGYNLVLLRGNSESAETILGYDVAPTDTDKSNSTKHLRPEWFERILRAEENGEKCLLFLDEITTATEYVQSALLHLIFERKVGCEDIPKSTLIVSAGNYASNLSNSMMMLPPLMNRFMIYNIVPRPDDVEEFLCKYTGSIIDKPVNYFDNIKGIMENLDNQEVKLDDKQLGKIGEYVERSICATARRLMTGGNRSIDLSVTELTNLYSDLDKDSKLPGFVTLRTLNYLRDVTIATYRCFGKAGITSDNYKNMITGLVGLGIIRNSTNGDVDKKDVTGDFYNAMVTVTNEIEKMNNTKLPEYEKFFRDIVSTADAKNNPLFEASELNAIINKIKELKADKELNGVERPIDPKLIECVCGLLEKSVKEISDIKVKGTADVVTTIPIEKLNGYVAFYLCLNKAAGEIKSLIGSKDRGYKEDTVNQFKHTSDAIDRVKFKLTSIRRLHILKDPALASIIPSLT